MSLTAYHYLLYASLPNHLNIFLFTEGKKGVKLGGSANKLVSGGGNGDKHWAIWEFENAKGEKCRKESSGWDEMNTGHI